jgi:hypothetical protein
LLVGIFPGLFIVHSNVVVVVVVVVDDDDDKDRAFVIDAVVLQYRR